MFWLVTVVNFSFPFKFIQDGWWIKFIWSVRNCYQFVVGNGLIEVSRTSIELQSYGSWRNRMSFHSYKRTNSSSQLTFIDKWKMEQRLNYSKDVLQQLKRLVIQLSKDQQYNRQNYWIFCHPWIFKWRQPWEINHWDL